MKKYMMGFLTLFTLTQVHSSNNENDKENDFETAFQNFTINERIINKRVQDIRNAWRSQSLDDMLIERKKEVSLSPESSSSRSHDDMEIGYCPRYNSYELNKPNAQELLKRKKVYYDFLKKFERQRPHRKLDYKSARRFR